MLSTLRDSYFPFTLNELEIAPVGHKLLHSPHLIQTYNYTGGVLLSNLIECTMCKKMISPNATACPNCGEPMVKKIETTSSEQPKRSRYPRINYDIKLIEYKCPLRSITTIINRYTDLNFIEAKELLENSSRIIATRLNEYQTKSIISDLDNVGAIIEVFESGTEIEELSNLRLLMNSESEKIEIENTNNVLTCPKCKSTSLSANKKGFGLGKAAGGAILLGPVGLLGGLVGSNKIKITCLSCGHVFKAGK